MSLTFFETATGLKKKRQTAARICRTIVSIVIDQSDCSILALLAAEAGATTYAFRAKLAALGRKIGRNLTFWDSFVFSTNQIPVFCC